MQYEEYEKVAKLANLCSPLEKSGHLTAPLVAPELWKLFQKLPNRIQNKIEKSKCIFKCMAVVILFMNNVAWGMFQSLETIKVYGNQSFSVILHTFYTNPLSFFKLEPIITLPYLWINLEFYLFWISAWLIKPNCRSLSVTKCL